MTTLDWSFRETAMNQRANERDLGQPQAQRQTEQGWTEPPGDPSICWNDHYQAQMDALERQAGANLWRKFMSWFGF